MTLSIIHLSQFDAIEFLSEQWNYTVNGVRNPTYWQDQPEGQGAATAGRTLVPRKIVPYQELWVQKRRPIFLIHVKEYATYISWRPKEHICTGDKYAGNSLYNRETYILYMKHNTITLTNTSIDRRLVPIKLSGRFLEIKLFSSRLRKWQNCVAGSHADECNLSKYFQVLAHSTS
jgi:hypothetical protein